MKNCLFKYKSHLATAFIGLCLVSTGCTDKFEEINTDPKGVDDSVTDMVDKIQSPLDNIIPPQEHRYQLWANLTTDIFAGFMMGVNDFGGSNNYNYQLRPDHCAQTYDDFYLYVFKYTSQYIPQCKALERFELAAMMQIANVAAILPVVTSYGPAQYSCVLEGSDTYYYDSEETIYKRLFQDLKEAVDYLPWMGEDSYTVERMNKGFAKGLLAKVALFAGGWSVRDGNLFADLDVEHHPNIPEMNGYFVGRPKNWKDYYELAAQQCAEILGATDNPHELDPSYENIWSTVNHLEYNKYNENLFEVAFGEGQNGDVGATMGYNLNRGTFNTTQGMGGAGYAATTAYYFYSFDPADTRRDVTCVFQEYTNENGKNKEVIRCNPLGVSCGKWRWYWMTDNYMKVRFPKANSRIATGINWILMRYSDIYLMFAEAQNELTGPDAVSPIAGMSPRQALEKVRERAFGTGAPEITQYDADFFTAIVNERAWEFGCESIRRQDLTRWGLLAEKIEEMKIGLCMLYDYKPVTIFGKTYQVDEIPRKIYYKYEDSNNPEYIDMSSVNFNEDMGTGTASTSKGQYECNWIGMQVTLNKDGDINTTLNTNYVKTMAKILVCGTGLNASYDYSELFGKLNWGGEAEAEFRKYSVGNGVCNYRHVFAIYYEDVNKTQGYVSNSYGYK